MDPKARRNNPTRSWCNPFTRDRFLALPNDERSRRFRKKKIFTFSTDFYAAGCPPDAFSRSIDWNVITNYYYFFCSTRLSFVPTRREHAETTWKSSAGEILSKKYTATRIRRYRLTGTAVFPRIWPWKSFLMTQSSDTISMLIDNNVFW